MGGASLRQKEQASWAARERETRPRVMPTLFYPTFVASPFGLARRRPKKGDRLIRSTVRLIIDYGVQVYKLSIY